ncbi:hypothetical protein MASR2M78_01720 [Treponema sp.]
MDEQVQAYLKPKTATSLSFRVGPLHRLDRQTSGLVTFSCTLQGAQIFSLALQERRLRKRYLGIFEGKIDAEEYWEDTLYRAEDQKITHLQPIGEGPGKAALTRVFPLASNHTLSLGLVEIGTGRTHQIRVQAASRKHPLLGDLKYGGQKLSGGFLLHAYELNTEKAPELKLKENVLAPLPDLFLNRAEQHFGKEIASILRRGLPTPALQNAIL